MDSLIYLYAAAVLVAGALAAIAIRAPRALWLRAGAVVLSGLLMATAYAGFAELLGRPKPTTLEWAAREMPEAIVLAADMREGEAIYLWLRMQDIAEPRAYVLPWSIEAAKQLHRAQGEAEKDGAAVLMRGPFIDGDEGGEQMFYAQPQKPLPPKLAQTN